MATGWLTVANAKYIINRMVVKPALLDAVFRALSDSTRRSLLRRLAGGGVLVKDLARPFAMSKQAVSKHLQVLEEAGLVEKVAEGRSTRVRLRAEPLRHIDDWISFYSGFWAGSLAALGNLVDGETERDT